MAGATTRNGKVRDTSTVISDSVGGIDLILAQHRYRLVVAEGNPSMYPTTLRLQGIFAIVAGKKVCASRQVAALIDR